ncbi:hypothetical protein CTI14_50635 [Methylobacterium radiotolerans]|nr:hypothetical protein CTI14_50635 [Methylobacterium radiotolerans]
MNRRKTSSTIAAIAGSHGFVGADEAEHDRAEQGVDPLLECEDGQPRGEARAPEALGGDADAESGHAARVER